MTGSHFFGIYYGGWIFTLKFRFISLLFRSLHHLFAKSEFAQQKEQLWILKYYVLAMW